MRAYLTILLVTILLAIASFLAIPAAFAQDLLYRCETADGISIQGTPCPKGASQKKIPLPRTQADDAATPANPAAPNPSTRPAPVAASAAPTIVPPAAPSGTHWVLVTDDALVRGPNQPYPLWQCMRADGSTYDSRDGKPGKQWVPTPATGQNPGAPIQDATPTTPIVRHMDLSVSVAGDTRPTDLGPPPPGAAAGQWVADQCQRLDPRQACSRFAARRDLLRRQIYAAKPSDRSLYAPEEQDLTSMLYSACGL